MPDDSWNPCMECRSVVYLAIPSKEDLAREIIVATPPSLLAQFVLKCYVRGMHWH